MPAVIIEDQALKGLEGNVVIVTGGSSGIGLATVSLALELGAKVVMGDRNSPPSELTHEAFTFVPINVTSWAELSSLFEKALELHGRIDHVFANAGVGPRMTLLEDKLDSGGKLLEPDFHVIDINLKSVMNTTALGLHYMKKQESGGSIVLTASASRMHSRPYIKRTIRANCFQRFEAVDYTTAKHGVLGLMRSLVPHLQSKLPIRINAIAPAWVNTGIVSAEMIRQMGYPYMEPPDVARAALTLMVDGTRNGQLIFSQATADGGVEHKEIDSGLIAAAHTLCSGPLGSLSLNTGAVSEKAATE